MGKEEASRHCRPLAGNLICSWQFNQTCEDMFYITMKKKRNRHSRKSFQGSKQCNGFYVSVRTVDCYGYPVKALNYEVPAWSHEDDVWIQWMAFKEMIHSSQATQVLWPWKATGRLVCLSWHWELFILSRSAEPPVSIQNWSQGSTRES